MLALLWQLYTLLQHLFNSQIDTSFSKSGSSRTHTDLSKRPEEHHGINRTRFAPRDESSTDESHHRPPNVNSELNRAMRLECNPTHYPNPETKPPINS
jgi:hypothetical protein